MENKDILIVEDSLSCVSLLEAILKPLDYNHDILPALKYGVSRENYSINFVSW